MSDMNKKISDTIAEWVQGKKGDKKEIKSGDEKEIKSGDDKNIFYNFQSQQVGYLPRIVISFLIFVISWIIAKFLFVYFTNLAKNTKNKENKIDIRYYEIGNIVYYLVIFIGFSISLAYLGLETTTLVTILGTLGLTLSLSLQSSLSNITSGIIISFNDLYQIGDTLEMNNQTNNIKGVVRDFTLFSTILSDVSTNKEIIVPNSLLQNNVIVNSSNIYVQDSLKQNIIQNENVKNINLKFKHI